MLQRHNTRLPGVAIGTVIGASAEIPYGSYASGMVYVPAGSSITTLTWHAAEKPGGTYLAAEDASSSAVTQTVAASQAHPIPTALQGAQVIKATGNAVGTIDITMKS